jgi:hypothetical protein
MAINQLAKINFSVLQKLLWKSSEHFGTWQTYLLNYMKEDLLGTRGSGVIYGGQISLVGGMQIQVAKGLAYFPNGELVAFDNQNVTLANGAGGVSRYDRIELVYSADNGTTVQLTDGNTRTFEFLQNGTVVVNQGTASVSPVAPALTSGRLSLGLITVGPSQVTLGSGDISILEDTALSVSPYVFGNGSKLRGSRTSGKLQFSHDGAIWSVVGAGGGGGGGANWRPVSGVGPIEDYDTLDEKIFKFSQGASQSIVLFFKVPVSYSPGTPIGLRLGHYSPSSTNNYKFQTTTTLIRKGVDAIDSTTNQRTSTNSDIVNTVAKAYVEATYDLTDTAGKINSVSVSASDLLKIQLTRVTPSGTEDSADVVFIPSLTEVTQS